MHEKKIRILFCVFADGQNVNAQSLNARDIAVRLDPERFVCTLFHAKAPDARLVGRKHIRLKHLPARLASFVIASEMLWGRHDILFYVQPSRASRLFWYLRAWGYSRKVLSTVESVLNEYDDSTIEEYLATLRRSHTCYAITDHIAKVMRVSYGINMSVIPVGANLDIFKPIDRSEHNSPWRVLFVGSMQPRKQPHVILDLAEHFRGEPVKFDLIGGVIGDPIYQERLFEEKRKRNLDNVHFYPPMPQEMIWEKMGKSDIFILPSRIEGLPKVTMEAAATGLPCIVCDDYHTPSVVDSLTGFHVKTFEDMAARVRLLIKDGDLRLRMGEAAVKHAKQFSWEVVARKWEEAFVKSVRQ